jgi:hypothetical protein
MRIHRLARVSFLFLLLVPAFAQHVHKTGPTTTKLSGADRPELIPDTEAYRAIFAAIQIQPAILDSTGIPLKERAFALRTISAYQTTFQALLKTQTPKTVQAEFRKQADGLLKRTLDNLANHMSAEGYGALQSFVQSEKQHMEITTVVE